MQRRCTALLSDAPNRKHEKGSVKERHQDERDPPPEWRSQFLGKQAGVDIEQVNRSDYEYEAGDIGADLQEKKRLSQP